MSSPKVLMVFPHQFGYNTDYFFYSQELSKRFDVTFMEIYMGLPKHDSGQIRLRSKQYKNLFSVLFYWIDVRKEMKKNYDVVFLNYFFFSSLLLILKPRKTKVIADVRTSYIYHKKFKRNLFNYLLKKEISLFKHISVISEGLKAKLSLPGFSHILPLGAPKFKIVQKDFSRLHFLYVGTFYQRDVHKTIVAFDRFAAEYRELVDLQYTIIGHGSEMDIQAINREIKRSRNKSLINYIGPIYYPELTLYFENSNVGVAYVPITEYFNHQPPTKTFEYLSAGLCVIATQTDENIKVINNLNGVLTDDLVHSVYQGMINVYENKNSYNSKDIQNAAEKYTWEYIVSENLIPYIERVIFAKK